MRGALVVGVLALSLAACSVDDATLRSRLYPCATSSDCGPGWGCVKASPYAPDFCAPSCDTPCDGICASDPTIASGLCLRGCTINADGSTSACQGPQFSCIRINVQSSRGVCYPVSVCDVAPGSRQGSCAAGQDCLSLTDHVSTMGFVADDLYCVPAAPRTATDPACPSGSILFPPDNLRRDPMGPQTCSPTCSVTDKRCPPAFGCFTQAPSIFGVPPFCIYGIYGIACDNDSNCFAGTCMSVPMQGNICTVTCEDAEMLAPGRGCPGLLDFFGGAGSSFYTMACDVASDRCAVQYSLAYIPCSAGYPCTGELRAGEPLDCRTFGSGTSAFSLCSTTCTVDTDCDDTTSRGFCSVMDASGRLSCLPKFGADAPCNDSRQCQSGLCRPIEHTCTAPPARLP